MPTQGPDLHQRKRRRTINSCSECYRRKQSCNHQRPCANCTSRNVASKCIYDESGNEEAYETFASAVASIGGQPEVLQQPSPPQDFRPRYWRPVEESDYGLLAAQPNAPYRKVHRHYLPAPESAEAKLATAVALLPPPHLIDQLVNVYFESCNWYHSVLERYYFDPPYQTWMKFLSSTIPKFADLAPDLKHFVPMLLGMFALALRYLPSSSRILEDLHLESAQDSLRLSQEFSDASIHLSDSLDTTSAANCIFPTHTDVLRVWWLKAVARGSDAWHMMSRAIRNAQEIRLHLKQTIKPSPRDTVEQTLSRVWEEESRRRLWTCLVFWDAYVGMTLNRPRIIVLDDCDVDPPMDCPFPSDPSKTLILNDRPVGQEFEQPTPYSAVLFGYKLALEIHKLRNLSARMKRDPRPAGAQHDPSELHCSIIQLYETIPATLRVGEAADTSFDTRHPYLPTQREGILSNVHICLTNLHRLFISSRPASRFAVLDSALIVLSSQERIFQEAKPEDYHFYGLVFLTIHATLLMFGVLESHPEAISGYEVQVAQATNLAVKRLEKTSAVNFTSRAGLQLVIPCRERSKHLFANAWTPNNATPTGDATALGTPNSLEGQIAVPHASQSLMQGPADSSNGALSAYPDGTTLPTENLHGSLGLELNNEYDVRFWTQQMDDVMDLQVLFPELYEDTSGSLLVGV